MNFPLQMHTGNILKHSKCNTLQTKFSGGIGELYHSWSRMLLYGLAHNNSNNNNNSSGKYAAVTFVEVIFPFVVFSSTVEIVSKVTSNCYCKHKCRTDPEGTCLHK